MVQLHARDEYTCSGITKDGTIIYTRIPQQIKAYVNSIKYMYF